MKPAQPDIMRLPPQIIPVIAALAAAMIFVAFVHAVTKNGISADFRALWLAAEWLAQGRPDLVYPADGAYFTMRPPREWGDDLNAQGFTGEVFPYLYPPIWVWLATHVVDKVPYDSVVALLAPLNAALILGMLALARRMAAPAMPLGLYWLIGSAFLICTTVGLIPIYQGQPQILIAFLTVLAFERAERGWFWLAGACLALAAALKIFPALFALIWLARGQKRALASFVLTGAAMGLASLWLTGWPLHERFLHMVDLISKTAMVTRLSYTWEGSLAWLLWYDQLIFIQEPIARSDMLIGWWVLPKPPLLAAIATALQLASLACVCRIAYRSRRQSLSDAPFLLASVVMLLTLAGPIGWSYYYLAAFAFLPALLARIGRWHALVTGALVLTTQSPITSLLLPASITNEIAFFMSMQLLGTLTMALLAVVFLATPLHRKMLPVSDNP